MKLAGTRTPAPLLFESTRVTSASWWRPCSGIRPRHGKLVVLPRLKNWWLRWCQRIKRLRRKRCCGRAVKWWARWKTPAVLPPLRGWTEGLMGTDFQRGPRLSRGIRAWQAVPSPGLCSARVMASSCCWIGQPLTSRSTAVAFVQDQRRMWFVGCSQGRGHSGQRQLSRRFPAVQPENSEPCHRSGLASRCAPPLVSGQRLHCPKFAGNHS